MQKKQKVNIVWFRKDLRTTDQNSLTQATLGELPVIALYCFDPSDFVTTRYGFKKTEKYRGKFLIESVTDLKKQLDEQNIPLVVKYASPVDAFHDLNKTLEIQNIFFQKEWTYEEKKVEKAVKNFLTETSFNSTYDQFLFHPYDVPYDSWREIPEVFTEFRKNCQKHCTVRTLSRSPRPNQKRPKINIDSSIPKLSDLGLENFSVDHRSAFPFEGGSTSARERVEHYFWQTHKLRNYKKTRNGLLGTDYSSKLSAWLSNGSISAREIYHEIVEFEDKVIKNQDTYWLIFELIWRDYFKYISLKHGNKIFKLNGLNRRHYNWKNDEDALNRWINGDTPEDFVNANMLEIKETGFMSNRGRQNVCSYWAKELKQDWRIGAAYFESMLVDYDVHSNWGNWMYNSGVGNDPRDRKFNILLQAERYDAKYKYRQLWLQKLLL